MFGDFALQVLAAKRGNRSSLMYIAYIYTLYLKHKNLLTLHNTEPLTAADVSCAVANTRKMANWMMCCMVSESLQYF